MKSLVAFFSLTGNTRKVAEAIFHALPDEKDLKTLAEVTYPEDYDLVFIGFPVMQFGPPREVRKFAREHPGLKKVALFVTHAMPAGSTDPFQKEMLERELGRCRELFPDVAGFFHCQGELAEKTAEELIASGIPMLAEFAAMRPLTIGHPDPAELGAARRFALQMG